MTNISGKTAIVTGAGAGIGKGLALALARRGASVVIADIMGEKAEQAAAEVRAAGGAAAAFECDVCDRASVQRLQDATRDAFGPTQLVFANAGATSFDPLAQMSDGDVDWILHVNLFGVMNTVRAFLPDLIEAREGHIIATASMAGLLPGWIPTHVPYSAAKAGVIGMMMNLQLELRPLNIYTTSYCPGGVASNMLANNALYRPDQFGGPGQEQVVPTAKSSIPFYTPDQVAPMVLRAVENNRPFVFDHPEQRKYFRETYANIVEACFDDSEAFEREFGKPAPNPTGAKL